MDELRKHHFLLELTSDLSTASLNVHKISLEIRQNFENACQIFKGNLEDLVSEGNVVSEKRERELLEEVEERFVDVENNFSERLDDVKTLVITAVEKFLTRVRDEIRMKKEIDQHSSAAKVSSTSWIHAETSKKDVAAPSSKKIQSRKSTRGCVNVDSETSRKDVATNSSKKMLSRKSTRGYVKEDSDDVQAPRKARKRHRGSTDFEISEEDAPDTTAEIKKSRISRASCSFSSVDKQVPDSSLSFEKFEEDMSFWFLLSSLTDDLPELPAVYEVKVKQAKKCAYIGCCEDLRERLIGHQSGSLSVEKNLDKFIKRNAENIEVRFKVFSTYKQACEEAENGVKFFLEKHSKVPAYNDQ